MRQYNSAMKSTVDNYRDEAKAKGISTNTYSDIDLFNVIEYWNGMSTAEEQLKCVLNDLYCYTKRNQ